MDVYPIHRFHLFFVENHLIGAERKRTILSLTVIITPFHFDSIEKNTTTICFCVCDRIPYAWYILVSLGKMTSTPF